MNYIIAQGAPGSMIRKFQEQPQLGVELLRALKDLFYTAELGHGTYSTQLRRDARVNARTLLARFGDDANYRNAALSDLIRAEGGKNRAAYYAALDKYLAL